MKENFHRIEDNTSIIIKKDREGEITEKSYPLDAKDYMVYHMLNKILKRIGMKL